jgi:hypothetical protein
LVDEEDRVKYVNPKEIEAHVNKSVVAFHHMRYKSLSEISLKQVLKKRGLHLFKARNILVASDLVKIVLEDLVSSFDETIFRQFLDDIALFIVSKAKWGTESASGDHEEEFTYQGNHYVVSVKMGQDYGKTTFLRRYRKIVGQNFWYFISGNENLYTDIIEPLGHRAKEHNDEFAKQKGRVINLFTQEFIAGYCSDGAIDWQKLVKFNSGNLNLPQKGC